ncbi:YitT family protein [Oceanobacillus luteolus]|uniref:YitT family protein n=1 Tax=Oceanobacillus luteolus TaxID=1274358 RepID=UPI00204257EB|nr:YitT family protein [Oceanobacillus luteolus]MCM3739330.1 YitT family protein [Oceanobacillus luteolus]
MKPVIIKYGLVIAGGIIQGFGMGLFLFPQYIPSGGAGGITVLLNYWFGLSMGTALWIVNFTLLLAGLYVLGKRFAVWTVIAITMTSLSVTFFEQIPVHNRNLMIDLVFGSIFLGIGIGILMRQNVSNGGTGVLALIISKKYNVLPGRSLFWINSFIFIFAAIIIDWKIIILALLSQWIATQVVNMIFQLSFDKSYTLGWRKK